MNPNVILSTINARYEHPSLGLRYLAAQLETAGIAHRIVEFASKTSTGRILEVLASHAPDILGLGVYIWNVTQLEELLPALRARLPRTVLVLGGPEVSYSPEHHPLFPHVDHVVEGEADLVFPELCLDVAAGKKREKLVRAAPPELAKLAAPYGQYSAEDLKNRFTYVEASRGCPFGCEFCLSSLDVPLRRFELDPFLQQIHSLHARGARRFKFIDRTFNLSRAFSAGIMRALLPLAHQGAFFHFEIVPDRLAPELLDLAALYPEGTLQFEVGIQSFNPEVAARIGRRQDYPLTRENLRWLRAHSSVHLHADLIAGLPGEDLESFSSGFNELWRLKPQEIQVGILKKLRGAPITRHDAQWEMRYSARAPYEVLSTRTMDEETLTRLKLFARVFDLYANRHRFPALISLLISKPSRSGENPFQDFLAFTDWLRANGIALHQLSLDRQFELLSRYLLAEKQLSGSDVTHALESDYHSKPGRKPACLRAILRKL